MMEDNKQHKTGRQEAVDMKWLTDKPALAAGVAWGVPWPIGELGRDETLALTDEQGQSIPVQSWPAAYWPDGSVKWTGHAALVPQDAAPAFKLVRGMPEAGEHRVEVRQMEQYWEVHTGVLLCRINRQGTDIVREIIREGRQVCAGARLTGIRETCDDDSGLNGSRTIRQSRFNSVISNVVAEQTGPVRAVLKVTGRHLIYGTDRQWLPFVLRLYFFAGHDEVRGVYSFLYDGNPARDRIRGIGLEFRVPMSGPLYNRHLRIAGDRGLFSESPKGLLTWRNKRKYDEMYREQTQGRPISFDPGEDAEFLAMLDDSAVWDSFKLVQLSADSYTITKRTKESCSWLKAASGQRARGLIYAGGDSGGIAVGLRHFWQKHPTALEASGLSRDEGLVTVWLWSPDAAPMDMRHYDTETHVTSAYEGAEEMRSTPYGVGNTSEFQLWCRPETPDARQLDEWLRKLESPPLLVCAPDYYHQSRTLGVWSLQDRSTPAKARLEDALDELTGFYMNEVEQRRWYGFWDYGDVMHSYDEVRHTWRYDLGGCAWQNTELAPNMWLWYTFLRTGREDVFRLAEAMARHTSEVDVYHIGEYAGLGSRHNVLHWGCGCKEARIGMAGLHRFYYYLTADERIGDIMDEVKDSDYTTANLDPMRYYYPKDEFPTHARSGPDWSAFCSNWMTRWERFEDTAYRDKLLTGIECLKQMPFRLLTGPVFGYDPKTGVLHFMGNENWGHHLIICMGGAQVWMELAELLQDSQWSDMLAEFGEFYNLSKEEKSRRTNGEINGVAWNIPMLSTAMMAYAAARLRNRELASQAWDILLKDETHWRLRSPLPLQTVNELEYIRPIREVPGISTNTASQWSINVIQCLELIGDDLPE